MKYIYEYPRPMVCTDIILFSKNGSKKELLLIKRLNNPFKDKWALPGGFVDENESLESAATRELFEETGIKTQDLKQFYSFGDFGRDPRGHCVSVVFYQHVDKKSIMVKAGDDAKDAQWFNISDLPELAFDHEKILKKAIEEII